MNTSTPTAQSRIPRPAGLTLAIRKTNNYPTKQKRNATKEIYKTIIRNYIQAGLCINGQVLGIQELGTYLNLTYKQVMVYVGLVTKELAGLLNTNQLQANHRALLFQAINNSLADRGKAQLQFDAMYHAQANDQGVIGYKPFVSGTVNIALTNLMAANKGIMDVAGKLVPNPSLAIQNNHYHEGDTGIEGTQAQYIGVEEAMKLIGAGQKEGTMPELTEAEVFEINELSETPDVQAKISDDPGASPLQIKATATNHEERRGKEEDLTDVEEMD